MVPTACAKIKEKQEPQTQECQGCTQGRQILQCECVDTASGSPLLDHFSPTRISFHGVALWGTFSCQSPISDCWHCWHEDSTLCLYFVTIDPLCVFGFSSPSAALICPASHQAMSLVPWIWSLSCLIFCGKNHYSWQHPFLPVSWVSVLLPKRTVATGIVYTMKTNSWIRIMPGLPWFCIFYQLEQKESPESTKETCESGQQLDHEITLLCQSCCFWEVWKIWKQQSKMLICWDIRPSGNCLTNSCNFNCSQTLTPVKRTSMSVT